METAFGTATAHCAAVVFSALNVTTVEFGRRLGLFMKFAWYNRRYFSLNNSIKDFFDDFFFRTFIVNVLICTSLIPLSVETANFDVQLLSTFLVLGLVLSIVPGLRDFLHVTPEYDEWVLDTSPHHIAKGLARGFFSFLENVLAASNKQLEIAEEEWISENMDPVASLFVTKKPVILFPFSEVDPAMACIGNISSLVKKEDRDELYVVPNEMKYEYTIGGQTRGARFAVVKYKDQKMKAVKIIENKPLENLRNWRMDRQHKNLISDEQFKTQYLIYKEHLTELLEKHGLLDRCHIRMYSGPLAQELRKLEDEEGRTSKNKIFC